MTTATATTLASEAMLSLYRTMVRIAETDKAVTRGLRFTHVGRPVKEPEGTTHSIEG